MKVLDLQCTREHVFEGWFASEDDFQSQLGRGLVTCPLCGDATVSKKLSAPRLNLGAARPAESPPAASAAGAAASPLGLVTASPAMDAVANAQAQWMKMVRHVMANTQDVGDKFADVARQMHYGDAEERSIRGQATREEAVALLEEGIEVMPLAVPDALKEPLQ
ncbi:MAG: DUF1178 family protein [Pseudomonadota bacterium]